MGGQRHIGGPLLHSLSRVRGDGLAVHQQGVVQGHSGLGRDRGLGPVGIDRLQIYLVSGDLFCILRFDTGLDSGLKHLRRSVGGGALLLDHNGRGGGVLLHTGAHQEEQGKCAQQC